MRPLSLSLVVLSACATIAPHPGAHSASPRLPWIENDYARARVAARAAGVPLFIDAWAPWCHTCLSMRSFTLADPGLAPIADRFVWLAIDTEHPENAAVTAKFPVTAWPTFFLVDPVDETIVSRWLGSASVPQLRAFLVDGERALELAHAGRLDPKDPLFLLAEGSRAATHGQPKAAARAFRAALNAAPPSWPRRPDVLSALIAAENDAELYDECAADGLAFLDATGNGSSAVDFAYFAAECAGKLPPADARIERLRRAAAERLAKVANDPTAALSADDRGDALRALWDLLEALGDPKGARAAAEQRLAVLDAAAAAAPDAQTAATFNWGRADSLLYLGRGDEAIAKLSRSEAVLPADYNPPHQLARVYFRLGRHAEALAAVDRAVAKAYGPRRASILGLRADILEALGKKDDARATVAEQVRAYESLPEGQKQPAKAAAAAERLRRLE